MKASKFQTLPFPNLGGNRALQKQLSVDCRAMIESKLRVIRVFFSEIVEEVIYRKALLRVSPKAGHLEFRAEILDESGNATSADLGHTYRKLLCIAFDHATLTDRSLPALKAALRAPAGGQDDRTL